eukprot:UN08161
MDIYHRGGLQSQTSSTTTLDDSYGINGCCCVKFRRYIRRHNNIINFQPDPDINLAEQRRSLKPNEFQYLPQHYSSILLFLWYIFFIIVLIPCKFILSILHYPIHYSILILTWLVTFMPCRSAFAVSDR